MLRLNSLTMTDGITMSVVCFHFIAMWDGLIIHATDAVDFLYSGRTNVTLTLSPPLRMSRICVRREARSASAVCGVFLVGVEDPTPQNRHFSKCVTSTRASQPCNFSGSSYSWCDGARGRRFRSKCVSSASIVWLSRLVSPRDNDVSRRELPTVSNESDHRPTTLLLARVKTHLQGPTLIRYKSINKLFDLCS